MSSPQSSSSNATPGRGRKGPRWSRRRTASGSGSEADVGEAKTGGYNPPPVPVGAGGNAVEANASTEGGETPGPSDFVTTPPQQRGLTSGISTLFRTRGSSREPNSREKRSRQAASGGGSSPSNQRQPQKSPPSGGARGAGGKGTKRTGKKKHQVQQKSQEHGQNQLQPQSHQSTMAKTLAAIDAQVPGAASGPGRTQSRIFSNDDSDDSYESRISSASATDDRSVASGASMGSAAMRRLVRFRGFSTSIQSLFLDESLVCASMGCFGLLLSQRTEFLLDARNQQRGLTRRSGSKSAHRHPSRLLAYALLVTVACLVPVSYTHLTLPTILLV